MMRGVERDGRHEMERERQRDWGTFKGGQGGRERARKGCSRVYIQKRA